MKTKGRRFWSGCWLSLLQGTGCMNNHQTVRGQYVMHTEHTAQYVAPEQQMRHGQRSLRGVELVLVIREHLPKIKQEASCFRKE